MVDNQNILQKSISLKNLNIELINILKRNKNITNFSNEAKIIIKHLLNISTKQFLLNNIQISIEDYNKCIQAGLKRIQGYPLQYIIGQWDFYNCTFYVGEGVLIPRSDTEILVDSVLSFIKKQDWKAFFIIDLCAGSGCIGISIDKNINKLSTDEFIIHCIEKDEKAFEYLIKNKKLNHSKINCINDDIFNYVKNIKDESVDIIVSNPPYLNNEDMEVLQKEVTFEPKIALYAQENGLYFYKNIIKLYSQKLKKNGLIAFEIGINQHSEVESLLIKNNFTSICQIKDFCGIIRVIIGIKN